MRLVPISCVTQTLAIAGRSISAASVAIALGIAIVSSAIAQTGGEPVHAVTYLDVSTDRVVNGVDLLKQYRDASSHQPGNLEFMVLQEISRPNRFAIVEGWKDQVAFTAHAKSADTASFGVALKAIRNSPPNEHALRDYADGPTRGTPGRDAIYMVEHIDFSPPANAAREPAVKALAQSSRSEGQVVRYDIYQEPPPHANHYSVVAIWPDRKAFDVHETAASTRQFRADTAMPARANLYDERLYNILN
jgi:quinol monooxygenase YgiN